MEGLIALGLAAATNHIVDFSITLLRDETEAHVPSRPVTVPDIRRAGKNLITLRSSLEHHLAKCTLSASKLSAEETAVIEIATACKEASQSISSNLTSLAKDPNQRRQVWASFAAAVRVTWNRTEALDVCERMIERRKKLSACILNLWNAKQRRSDAGALEPYSGQHEIVEIKSYHLNALRFAVGEQPYLGHKHIQIAETNAEELHAETVVAIVTTRDGACRSIGTPLLSNRPISGTSALDFDHLVTSHQKAGLDETIDHNAQVRLSTAKLSEFINHVLAALPFQEMHGRQNSIVAAHETTFDWVFSSPQQHHEQWASFTEWLRAGSGCYWITGKPGSGKSTLMKFISKSSKLDQELSHWSGNKDLIVGFFFFWYAGSSLQNSQAGLLRSLLHQLLRERPGLTPMLFPDLCRSWSAGRLQEGMELPVAELKKAFLKLSEVELLDAKVCFVVDGVDEYFGDHLELAEVFSRVTQSGGVKVLLSSRPIPSCEDLWSDFPQLKLQDLSMSDIKTFTEDKLTGHPLMRYFEAEESGATTRLVDAIATKSCGVFLWVALVAKILVQGLEDYETLPELHSRLNQLPDDLPDLYGYMLTSMSLVDRIRGSKLLQSVLISSKLQGQYPMTLLQLSFADGTDLAPLSESCTAQRSHDELRRCQSTVDILQNQCCGLIEAVEPWSRQHGVSGKIIQFLHRTVVEFLHDQDKRSDVFSLTEKTNFDVTDVLLKSSCAEMKTKLFSVGSTDPDSLLSRALLRVLTYGRADQYALELCSSKYISQAQRLMSRCWKVAEKRHTPSAGLGSAEPLLMLAADNCHPQLLDKLLDTVDCSHASTGRDIAREEFRTLFAARLLGEWAESMYMGRRNALAEQIIVCRALPNLPIMYKIGSGPTGKVSGHIWTFDRQATHTPTEGWSIWMFILWYVMELLSLGKYAVSEHVNAGLVNSLLELILTMMRAGAELQFSREFGVRINAPSPIQVIDRLFYRINTTMDRSGKSFRVQLPDSDEKMRGTVIHPSGPDEAIRAALLIAEFVIASEQVVAYDETGTAGNEPKQNTLFCPWTWEKDLSEPVHDASEEDEYEDEQQEAVKAVVERARGQRQQELTWGSTKRADRLRLLNPSEQELVVQLLRDKPSARDVRRAHAELLKLSVTRQSKVLECVEALKA